VVESDGKVLWSELPSSSFLEYVFVRWVLSPAVVPSMAHHVFAQSEVEVDGRLYRIDYELRGEGRDFAVELDGFEFRGRREAFTYDRLRQSDLHAAG
jgi:hypothetical protein